MTFQIRKDQLPFKPDVFAAVVQMHAAALNEYRAHLRGVAEDAENPELKPEDRRVAFPGPDAHNLVKSAITLDGATDQYVPDYELVGPPLAEKKQALFAQVTQMENDAIEANIPAAKRRHWQFVVQDGGYLPDWQDRVAKQEAIQRWAAKLHADIYDLTEATVDAFVIAPFNG